MANQIFVRKKIPSPCPWKATTYYHIQAHCGKGRTRDQGSHVVMIMHVFMRQYLYQYGSTAVWESLSLIWRSRNFSLWRTLPDIVERGGLVHIASSQSGLAKSRQAFGYIWTAHDAGFGVLRLGAASVSRSVAWCAL